MHSSHSAGNAAVYENMRIAMTLFPVMQPMMVLRSLHGRELCVCSSKQQQHLKSHCESAKGKKSASGWHELYFNRMTRKPHAFNTTAQQNVHRKQSSHGLMQDMHADDTQPVRQQVSVHLQKACGSSAQPYMGVRKAPLEGPCRPTELKYCLKACKPCSTVIIPEVEAEAAAAGSSAAG